MPNAVDVKAVKKLLFTLSISIEAVCPTKISDVTVPSIPSKGKIVIRVVTTELQ